MKCVICWQEATYDPASYIDGAGQPCLACSTQDKKEKMKAELELCKKIIEFCRKGVWN
jgi:hypothetical protein